jgi:branched-chain amino acid transport system ATP-binding protein
MGRNGMGKTTLIRTLMGQLPARGGAVLIDGAEATREPPFRRARRGIAVVPEGRGVFGGLSVLENLRLAARPAADGAEPWPLERVLTLFPRLAQRSGHRGDQLSGGEQQMLAIGRALMTSPRLLILDEATEGLAPIVRDGIWRTIRTVREAGIATLVVDKTVSAVLSLVDRAEILVKAGGAEGRPGADAPASRRVAAPAIGAARARRCGRRSPGPPPHGPPPRSRSPPAAPGIPPRPGWRGRAARPGTPRSPRHGPARW